VTTKDELVQATDKFFELHWPAGVPRPSWDFSWNWKGAVSNYQLGGVYALFNSEALVYVGLGASRGGGIYENRGISRRLNAHVTSVAPVGSSTDYVAKDRWLAAGVNLIATIGFPLEFTYLSCALEDYLLSKLNPPENRLKRNRAIA
jgi:hypothetical protein